MSFRKNSPHYSCQVKVLPIKIHKNDDGNNDVFLYILIV